MAEHNELGKKGEQLAAEYLEKKGFTILEKNFVYQKAEIDIIAQNQNTLIVVEVKTRSSIDFGSPEEFVKPSKIKLLVKAIDHYVISRNIESKIQFDIIAVFKKGSSFKIEHIEDAFYFF